MSGRTDGLAISRWGGRDRGGREDIGCGLAEVRALCGRKVSTPLSTALTEDDETCVEPISCSLGQEIFQSLPVLTVASDVLSKEAVKTIGNLVEGTEGTVPLSKSNGTETASTVMPA